MLTVNEQTPEVNPNKTTINMAGCEIDYIFNDAGQIARTTMRDEQGIVRIDDVYVKEGSMYRITSQNGSVQMAPAVLVEALAERAKPEFEIDEEPDCEFCGDEGCLDCDEI